MLFAAYGAPPSAPRQSNPLLIILGVCGGCALLVIIGLVAMTVWGVNATKGLIGGAVQMQQNMPKFLGDLKNHNYSSAAALVDPSAQSTLTEENLKSTEEAMEKKLGPMTSYGARYGSQSQNTVTGSNGQPSVLEYTYTYPVTYQKGSATATFKFRTDTITGSDISKMRLSGKIAGFKLESD